MCLSGSLGRESEPGWDGTRPELEPVLFTMSCFSTELQV